MANTLVGIDPSHRPQCSKNRGVMAATYTLDTIGDAPPINLSDFEIVTFLFRKASGNPVFSINLFDTDDGTTHQGDLMGGTAITSIGPQSLLTPVDQVIPSVTSLTGGTVAIEVRAK